MTGKRHVCTHVCLIRFVFFVFKTSREVSSHLECKSLKLKRLFWPGCQPCTEIAAPRIYPEGPCFVWSSGLSFTFRRAVCKDSGTYQQTMLVWCWASVVDGGQHQTNIVPASRVCWETLRVRARASAVEKLAEPSDWQSKRPGQQSQGLGRMGYCRLRNFPEVGVYGPWLKVPVNVHLLERDDFYDFCYFFSLVKFADIILFSAN